MSKEVTLEELAKEFPELLKEPGSKYAGGIRNSFDHKSISENKSEAWCQGYNSGREELMYEFTVEARKLQHPSKQKK